MKTKYWLVVILAGTQVAAVPLAKAQSDTNNETDIELLKQQIQNLEQKVDNLERKQQEAQSVGAKSVVQPAPSLTVGADGVNFRSADSNFVAGLHAWLQVDSRTFFQDEHVPGIDGFLLRRARIIFAGTVYHDFDYYFNSEFAGSGAPQILDAYLNYHYRPEIQLQFGKFKPPVGLEALEPDIYTFLNERSLATDLVPYRDIGAQFHGDALGGVFSYFAGVFNGLPDYNTTTINANYE